MALLLKDLRRAGLQYMPKMAWLLLWPWLASGQPVLAQTQLTLTPDEQRWLSEHPVLTVASSTGWAPVSYMGENGQFTGIAIDHLKEIEKILGVRFVFYPANDQNFTQDVHVISALTNPKANTPAGYIASGKPYIRTRLGIYTQRDKEGIHSLEDLHGKRVVVFQNRLAAEMLERDHPQIKLIRADIAEEALETLINGNVEAYVGNIAVINYTLNNQGIGNVVLSGLTPYSSEIFWAVSDRAPEFAALLQKALDAIPESKHNEIDERWVRLTVDKSVDYVPVLTAFGFLLLLLLLAGFKNRRLVREVTYRQLAEKDIKKSHGMLGNVLNTIPVGVFWVDTEGRYIGCNRVYASMVGLVDPQSIVGKRDVELPHGLLWPKFEEYCQLVMHESTPVHVGVERIGFCNKGGIIAKSELVPLKMSNGVVYGMLVTIEDISPLRDSEERSRAVFESSLDCLVTIDAEGRIVSVNPAVEQTFGYSMTEMLGNKMADLLIPPEMREAHETGMKRHLETDYSGILGRRIEVMAMRKGGEVFPVELTVVPFEASLRRYFLGSLRDISERRHKENLLEAEGRTKAALIAELAKMRRAIDEHNSIVVTDRNAIILYVNQKFCDVSGYTKSDLIGAPVSKLKSGVHGTEFYAQMWNTILAGKTWNGVLANKTNNGNLYWVNTTIVPILGDDGEITQFISIRTDVSEIHHLKEALEQLIRREQTIGFEIQQTLLYGPTPVIKNVQISAFTEASLGVDGDFYDIQMLTVDKFDVAIGDVMGKGTSAALIAAATKQKISHTLAERHMHQKLPLVEEVVTTIQQQMVNKLIELERFLTLFYCRIDLGAMAIHYADCGHGLALHAKADGVHPLRGDNLPVGVTDTDPVKIQTSPIIEGDIILLYSDGVTDATNMDGARFGDADFIAMLSEAHAQGIPACVLTNLLEQRVRNFEAGQPVADDRTIIAIRIEKDRPGLRTMDLGWDIDGLSIVRQAVQTAAEGAGLRDEKCQGLMLAAVESFTNILRHAHKPSSSAAIHCRIETLVNAVRVDFYYVGEPFSPDDGIPDFSGETEGGFGLYIVRNSVDDVVYSSPIPGVCLTRLVQEMG